MTNTLVSPPSATPPVRRRDLAGSAHAQPTATLNPACARKTQISQRDTTLPTAPRPTRITLAPLTRPASPSEKQTDASQPRVKSP